MKNKWIHFSIDRESLIGMLSGVGIVILSVIMTIFNNYHSPHNLTTISLFQRFPHLLYQSFFLD